MSAESRLAGNAGAKQRRDGKAAAVSCASIVWLMLSEHANPLGNAHGDRIMKTAERE